MKNPPAVSRLEVRYEAPYGHVNNAVYLEFFEQIRIDYWRALADLAGIEDLVAGDVPGARYVIAETTVRFKAPVFSKAVPKRRFSPRTVRRRPTSLARRVTVGGFRSQRRPQWSIRPSRERRFLRWGSVPTG